MNQQKLSKLGILFVILSSLVISDCSSPELKALKETTNDFYKDELDKIQQALQKKIYYSGKISAQQMGLSTVYMKVIFQRDSTYPPEDSKYIKYQPWWNTKEGLWGFTGVAQRVYESLSDEIESQNGPVIGVNQDMFTTSKKVFKKILYPVKVPTGGFEKRNGFVKTLDLAHVTSYKYGAFSANEGRSVAQASVDKQGAIFFPYFNIFLNKDLATVTKLKGELIINYKAFLNGYFMLCNHELCQQATLPKGQHLTITVPLPPQKALGNAKKQEAINLLAQKHLSQIMTDLAWSALQAMKVQQPKKSEELENSEED